MINKTNSKHIESSLSSSEYINNKNQTINSSKTQNSRVIYDAIRTGLAISLIICFFILTCTPILREWGYYMLPARISSIDKNTDLKLKQFKKDVRQLEKRVAALRYRNKSLTPRVPYLIIDTSDNLFFLKTGNKILQLGNCSTGSYTLLKTVDEKEEWIFKTPRGMFRIQNKIEDPVWRMPDWAFIEEGKPVPSPFSSERFEPGVLGDYALDLGDGYLIHGTLYQRFLGMPVTHGCVRLGDKELSIVYHSLRIGSKVFIY